MKAMATQLTRIELMVRQTAATVSQISQLVATQQSKLGMISSVLSDHTAILARIEQDVSAPEPSDNGPIRLTIVVPILLNKQGAQVMPGTINFTDDHDEKVTLNWADDVGAVHPTTPTTVASSDPTVATGDVTADNNFLFARSVGDGVCDLTLSNEVIPGTVVTDIVHVVIGPPVATSLNADAATAISVPKGTTA